jgi:hypothetical protein
LKVPEAVNQETYQDASMSIHSQLAKYMHEQPEIAATSTPLSYWHGQLKRLPHLAAFAEDLVSAPASQAYVERIFSVAGILTAGRRNRTKKYGDKGLLETKPSYLAIKWCL